MYLMSLTSSNPTERMRISVHYICGDVKNFIFYANTNNVYVYKYCSTGFCDVVNDNSVCVYISTCIHAQMFLEWPGIQIILFCLPLMIP